MFLWGCRPRRRKLGVHVPKQIVSNVTVNVFRLGKCAPSNVLALDAIIINLINIFSHRRKLRSKPKIIGKMGKAVFVKNHNVKKSIVNALMLGFHALMHVDVLIVKIILMTLQMVLEKIRRKKSTVPKILIMILNSNHLWVLSVWNVSIHLQPDFSLFIRVLPIYNKFTKTITNYNKKIYSPNIFFLPSFSSSPTIPTLHLISMPHIQNHRY